MKSNYNSPQIFLLLLIFLLTLFHNTTSPQPHETEYYTQLSDKCYSDKCVLFSNFSFEYIWQQYPLEKAIEDFNEIVQAGQLGYAPNKFNAVYDKAENRMKLIANQDLEVGSLLAESNIKDLLRVTAKIDWEFFTDDSVIQKTVKSLGRLKQDKFDDKFMNLLYFILSILTHLHNIEDSLLKAEFLVLPRQMNLPAFTFTEYEIDLIKTDGLHGEILGPRYSIQQSFKGFQKIIHSSFTKKQLNILFNRHKILEQDFLYAYALIFFFSPSHQTILKGYFKQNYQMYQVSYQVLNIIRINKWPRLKEMKIKGFNI